MKIRDARDGDWERIWPFWRQIVRAGETYAWDPDTTEPEARALWTGPGRRVFVVTDGSGALVASAYVKANYGGPAADLANAGFMVDPAHAGHGYGRALAEHVLAAARADGYRAMVFNAVVATNPAVHLWSSLGFTVVGTIPDAFDHPRHGRVALHVMQRTLQEGDAVTDPA
ncbi:GNAT family N-acetyltransferase [Streptomyces sp. SID14478]|uniref:GNAT family N-acetyltransferase n=1 Tax=Streptomyces sp. SID14478 TaxID=2706073 RepID=UPI0013DF8BFA|nr:GNAT family N-acetyltransferase [Streptomyces sp. SID14478]NEB81301.1 GNAT family N-acetyltransferase [Streptomyces sp. SID14478]